MPGNAPLPEKQPRTMGPAYLFCAPDCPFLKSAPDHRVAGNLASTES